MGTRACIQNDGFCIKNDEFCIRNDGYCIKNDSFVLKPMNFGRALSLAEIDKAVAQLWPLFNHKKVLMRAYHAADVSADGFIGRKEFRLLLQYMLYFNRLWAVFEQIDLDNDHRLTLHEFREGCVSIGLNVGLAEAGREFHAMDENNDGFILFNTFCVWSARRQVAFDNGDGTPTSETLRDSQGDFSTGSPGSRSGRAESAPRQDRQVRIFHTKPIWVFIQNS